MLQILAVFQSLSFYISAHFFEGRKILCLEQSRKDLFEHKMNQQVQETFQMVWHKKDKRKMPNKT